MVILGFLLAVSAAGLGGATLTDEFHRTFALPSSGRVSLNHITGDVHIAAWDRDVVKVDAVKRAGTQAGLDETIIVIESGPDFLAISTQYDEDRQDSQPASIEYTITVPRRSRLDEIKLVNGRIEIVGVAGPVKASSVNGTVSAQKLAGDADLSTVNGPLEATFERVEKSCAISMRSVNGAIMLSVPADAQADFAASNVSGGIDNDFGLPVARGSYPGTRLNGVVKGGGARIRINNVNGGIRIVTVVNGRRVRLT